MKKYQMYSPLDRWLVATKSMVCMKVMPWFMAVAAVLGMAFPQRASAITYSWSYAGSANWNIASNWTDMTNANTHAVPTSVDRARLAYLGDYEVLVTDTQAVDTLQLANSLATNAQGRLRIGNGGTLSIGTGGIISSDQQNGKAYIYIDSGGTLNSSGIISWGRASNSTTTSEIHLAAGGAMNLTGANGILYLGGGLATARGYGVLYQTGGTFTATSLQLDTMSNEAANSSKGYYEVSGTSTVTVSTSIINGSGTSSYDDGTIKVIGSKSTISVTGASGSYSQGTHSKLEFALDNGGASKINLTGASSTATLGNGTTNAGSLLVSFKAGAVLTTTSSFRLVEAKTVTGGFTNMPNSTLWTGAIQSVENSRQAYVLSYNAAANKSGSPLSLAGNDHVTFSASAVGYVEISGLLQNQIIQLYLDANPGEGKSIADLLAYFNLNGLSATAISVGDYDISLSFTAGAAGSSYFGWDLSSFNATSSGSGPATLSALQVVPEPGTVWLLVAGLGVLVLTARRRRRQMAL